MAETTATAAAAINRLGENSSPPIRSLPRFVCKRTVEALETLLQRARAGEVVGIAYSAAIGRNYSVDAVGTFADDPTFARGAVAALDDELRCLMQDLMREAAR